MKTNQWSSERGQAMVLIVLAIVGIMGFSALAIDGGMLYSERRRAQNAADTAVFAAAMAGLQGDDYEAAGKAQARLNGFVNEVDGKNQVTVITPPSSGVYAGQANYYQVIIKTEFSPFFAQFVYSGKLQNTVEAVAKAKPSTSISPGNAVHATSSDSCHAVWFQGSSGSTIYDAGVYSNSSVGADSNCAAIAKKSGDLTVQNGSINAVGGILGADDIVMKDKDGNLLSTAQKEANISDNLDPADRLEISIIQPPVCNGMTVRYKDDAAHKISNGVYELLPGIYPDGIDVGNDNVTLNPGMYCLDDDLSMTANNAVLTGEGVLIYMRGPSGDPSIKITGGKVVLNSFTGGTLLDNASPQKDWSGMVIFMQESNEGSIELTGGADSRLWGTVYAPGPYDKGNKSAKCDLTGSASSFNFRAQVICYTVRITGSVNLAIHYEEQEQYQEPPMVELSQ